MQLYQSEIFFNSPSRGTYDITHEIALHVQNSGITTGTCHIFIKHTSASLIITENADARVRLDIEDWMQQAVRDGDPKYRHYEEGDDDMSAHIRCMLTDMSQTIPVTNGYLNLGSWQGLFLYEHRTGRYERKMIITIQGL